jgi:hypothetical protein
VQELIRGNNFKAVFLSSLLLAIIASCLFLGWYALYGKYPVYRGQSGSTVIVFVSDQGPGTQLYAISPNGKDPSRLTYHRGSGFFGLPIGGYFQDLVINEQPLAGPNMKGIRYISNFEREGLKQYYMPLDGRKYYALPSIIAILSQL